jgi:arabinogalactan oligomer/maltooligosaccharide transport system permease protein
MASLFDRHFDKTLFALPVTGIFVFTVLPIVFMICVAFTNYDKNHQAPTNLFTWVGLDNFKRLLSYGSAGLGPTFVKVLAWTLTWAFFATFIDYFLGLAVAMLINKKGVKFKKLWRTILVLTIAVPQFVSLLYIMKLFANDGLINGYLIKWGWISSPIQFWVNPMLARITIIVINIWIGIPYLMLIATGLLMNIPEDLYESARIDGASGWQMFRRITLPYMLFVTGPFLLTQFTGNLNNFNVIYLLTQGNPKSMRLAENAGSTDLLVTWLYKMTVNDTNYSMAAVIGIMVFIVTAVVSLVVYNTLPSVKDEEGFQ